MDVDVEDMWWYVVSNVVIARCSLRSSSLANNGIIMTAGMIYTAVRYPVVAT